MNMKLPPQIREEEYLDALLNQLNSYLASSSLLFPGHLHGSQAGRTHYPVSVRLDFPQRQSLKSPKNILLYVNYSKVLASNNYTECILAKLHLFISAESPPNYKVP
jgi:hypothetical protein